MSAADKTSPERSSLDVTDLRTLSGMDASAQVNLAGTDLERAAVHVGSPRYIAEVCSQAPGDNPILRRFLSDEYNKELGDGRESSTLSVRWSRRMAEGGSCWACRCSQIFVRK